MCWHKRIVFKCNHFAWGSEVSPCVVQTLFDAGKWTVACDTMDSHPLHSVNVQRSCKKCLESKVKIDGTMSRLKCTLKELNESMAKLRKEVESECEEEDESIAGDEETTARPVTIIRET